MNLFSTKDENTFKAKLKILHNNNQIKLLEIINNYLKKYHKNDCYILEKVTSNVLILDFKNNTDTANCVLRYLKIKKLENNDLSNIICSVKIKIVNSFSKPKNFHKSKLLMLSPMITICGEQDSIKDEKRGLSRNYNSSNNYRFNTIQKLYFLNNTSKNKILNDNKNKVNKSVINKQRKNIIEDLFFLNEQKNKKLDNENKEVNNNFTVEENNISKSNNNFENNNLSNIINTENNSMTRDVISIKKNSWLIQARSKLFEKNLLKISIILIMTFNANEPLDYSNRKTINNDEM